jgi:hypothetical protein
MITAFLFYIESKYGKDPDVLYIFSIIVDLCIFGTLNSIIMHAIG